MTFFLNKAVQDQRANLPALGAVGTVSQFCAHYHVSRTTWWRISKSPGFPAPLRFGRSVRWNSEAVEAFLTRWEVSS